jgi:hypothetical protein
MWVYEVGPNLRQFKMRREAAGNVGMLFNHQKVERGLQVYRSLFPAPIKSLRA